MSTYTLPVHCLSCAEPESLCQCKGGAKTTPAAYFADLYDRYTQCVRTLQDIAAMGKKAGSESARHRLIQIGEPVEPGEQHE